MSGKRGFTRFLAFFCTVCPFCIARRRWPQSMYARTLNRLKLRRACPFCTAYDKLQKDRS